MPALNKLKSKGVILAQSIAAVYTALAGLMSVDVSGEKNTTTDTTTLDQANAYRTHDPDGYADNATIKADGLYDPAHTTYTALAGLISAPATTNFKVTYTDSGPTSAIYPVTGVGIDKKAAVGKMIEASINLQTSGAPS